MKSKARSDLIKRLGMGYHQYLKKKPKEKKTKKKKFKKKKKLKNKKNMKRSQSQKLVTVKLKELPFVFDKYRVDLKKSKKKKRRRHLTMKKQRKRRMIPLQEIDLKELYFENCSKSKIKDKSDEIRSSDQEGLSIFKLEENYDFFKNPQGERKVREKSFENELKKLREARTRGSVKHQPVAVHRAHHSHGNLHYYKHSSLKNSSDRFNEENFKKKFMKKKKIIVQAHDLSNLNSLYESVEFDHSKGDWRDKIKESIKKLKFNI